MNDGVQPYLSHIFYHLPKRRLTNKDLIEEFGTWTEKKIRSKTGVEERAVASETDTASFLATKAAEKLFQETGIDRSSIDMLMLCTETPDYLLPATACLVHHNLGLPNDCGAFDISLGCSGYIYGLHLASAMIQSTMARRVLFLTGDVLSHYIHPKDKSTRTIFGDCFTASLINSDETGNFGQIGHFVLGTDGSGSQNLIIPAGGAAQRCSQATKEIYTNRYGNSRTPEDLYMNGPEVFAFALREVPPVIDECLKLNSLTIDEVDLFVFHQATDMMLQKLRHELNIPENKFIVDVAKTGNTVSSSIPLALRRAMDNGRLHPGAIVLLCGFGVGYSWGATILRL
ncbi:MAG: 3-oxoacyl-ACP synthase [Dethiosulfovibrio peptidovorans]|nr:MAG: 3-oxoacyl-ACP synthase [Dethiosulfovibrio peptidovorans]